MNKYQNKISKLTFLFLLVLLAAQSCMVSSLHPLYRDRDRVHLDELNGVWIDKDQTRYEITTVVDTTGLDDLMTKMESVSKIKHKVGSKLKVKYNQNSNTTETNDSIIAQFRLKGELDHKDIMYYLYPESRKHYQIKMISKGDIGIFDGILSKLDGHYFMDLISNEKYLESKLGNSQIGALIARTHGFFKINMEGDKVTVNTIEEDDFEELVKNKRIRIEHVKQDHKIIITAKTTDIQKFLIKFADTEIFNDPDEALILKRIK